MNRGRGRGRGAPPPRPARHYPPPSGGRGRGGPPRGGGRAAPPPPSGGRGGVNRPAPGPPGGSGRGRPAPGPPGGGRGGSGPPPRPARHYPRPAPAVPPAADPSPPLAPEPAPQPNGPPPRPGAHYPKRGGDNQVIAMPGMQQAGGPSKFGSSRDPSPDPVSTGPVPGKLAIPGAFAGGTALPEPVGPIGGGMTKKWDDGGSSDDDLDRIGDVFSGEVERKSDRYLRIGKTVTLATIWLFGGIVGLIFLLYNFWTYRDSTNEQDTANAKKSLYYAVLPISLFMVIIVLFILIDIIVMAVTL